MDLDVFILTTDWYDKASKNHVVLFGKTTENQNVKLIFTNTKPVFFTTSETELPESEEYSFTRKSVPMKTTGGKAIDALYFKTQKGLRLAAEEFQEKGIAIFEHDINPDERFLMERMIYVQVKVRGEYEKIDDLWVYKNPQIKRAVVKPELSVASLDIESGAHSGTLYSIAVHMKCGQAEEKIVFMLAEEHGKDGDDLFLYSSERDLLEAFFHWWKMADPDVLIGWFVIGFDLMFLERKCLKYGISFDFGRETGGCVLSQTRAGRYIARIPGRVVIDGIQAVKDLKIDLEDYKLETVAQLLMGKGKLIASDDDKIAEIDRLFFRNKRALADYNIEDCVLVSDIFEKLGVIDLWIRRSQLSGMVMDKLNLSQSVFDHFYMPRFHRKGLVSMNPSSVNNNDLEQLELDHFYHTGSFKGVLRLAFDHFYPSLIAAFNIDLNGLFSEGAKKEKAPGGESFSKASAIMPAFFKYLADTNTEERDKGSDNGVKAAAMVADSLLYALCANNNRFYNSRIVQSLVECGKWMTEQLFEFFSSRGHRVIYLSTRSMFIELDPSKNYSDGKSIEAFAKKLERDLASRIMERTGREVNLSFRSAEFFNNIFLAKNENKQLSSRVVLAVEAANSTIDFFGFDLSHSDWTDIAEFFKVQLFECFFKASDSSSFIESFCSKLKTGIWDSKLVYRKKLNKKVEEYSKPLPMHVRAASMLENPGKDIEYVMTVRGPVPTSLNHSDIDYDYYIDRQLKPVANVLLKTIGKSFDSAVGGGKFKAASLF